MTQEGQRGLSWARYTTGLFFAIPDLPRVPEKVLSSDWRTGSSSFPQRSSSQAALILLDFSWASLAISVFKIICQVKRVCPNTRPNSSSIARNVQSPAAILENAVMKHPSLTPRLLK